MKWVIYVLKDPRTDEVRYVGQTSCSLEKRLRHHMYESNLNQNTRKKRWIFSLLGAGVSPTIEVVHAGDGPHWGDEEKRWISIYRERGALLVNATSGGQGFPGWGTPEMRKERDRKRLASTTPESRRAAALKAWATKSEETRLSFTNKGLAALTPEKRSETKRRHMNSLTAEQRAENSERARKQMMDKSAEERSAFGKLGQGKRTSEDLRQAAIKWQAAKTPAERSDVARKRWATRRAKKQDNTHSGAPPEGLAAAGDAAN